MSISAFELLFATALINAALFIYVLPLNILIYRVIIRRNFNAKEFMGFTIYCLCIGFFIFCIKYAPKDFLEDDTLLFLYSIFVFFILIFLESRRAFYSYCFYNYIAFLHILLLPSHSSPSNLPFNCWGYVVVMFFAFLIPLYRQKIKLEKYQLILICSALLLVITILFFYPGIFVLIGVSILLFLLSIVLTALLGFQLFCLFGKYIYKMVKQIFSVF